MAVCLPSQSLRSSGILRSKRSRNTQSLGIRPRAGNQSPMNAAASRFTKNPSY